MADDLIELLRDEDVQKQFALLSPEQQIAFAWRAKWLGTAHSHQVVPPGDWLVWLLLAGRGAGKTRVAAEQIGWWAWENPGSRWLVAAPTSADIRATCYEGVEEKLIERPASCVGLVVVGVCGVSNP